MMPAALREAVAPRALLDTAMWQVALDSFTQVTGLTAALYDADEARLVGPLPAAPLAKHFDAAGHFRETGAATAIERALVRQSIARRDLVTERLEGALVVSALPFFVDGNGIGALVFGWTFTGYSDPLECERLARRFGLSGHALWSVVRQQRPMSPAAFEKAATLLRTLVDSSLTQLAMIEHLRGLSDMRQQFLARVSHELRSPLQSMIARVELMSRSAGLPPGVKQHLDALKQSAMRESVLVEDLLDVSRSTTGRLTLKRHPLELGRIIGDAVEQARPLADAAGVNLVHEHGPAPMALVGDAQRLGQVVQNLISNALGVTPEGGTVAVIAHGGAGAIGFDVVDTGVGIEAAMLARIFDPFVQGAPNADGRGGLGLGLAIARYIVEAHGGEIRAHSDGPGHGARFAVRLPA